jgi:Ca2+-binding EF-hand superfamily protein
VSANPEHVFIPLTLLDFKELWRTHFRVEILAEDLRHRLEANPLFSLVHAFEVCDLNNTGEVSVHELRQLISSRGLLVTDKEATSLLDKFDKGKRGTVTKSEFLQEMVPRSSPQKFY